MSNRKDFSNANQSETSSGNSLKIILGVLLVLAIAAAGYFGFNSNYFQGETVKLQGELNELNETKDQLEGELQKMEGEYEAQITENETLQSEIEQKVQEVDGLKNRLAQVRSQLVSSQANSKKIKERLAQLEELKVALETDIQDLRLENTELMATNDLLNSDLVASKEEVERLNLEVATLSDNNKVLNERLFTLAPAGYRADNFSIIAEKRNDKLTNKAKQVDEVKIKFSLNDVPREKHGESELYIAITNLRGDNVKVIPAKNVLVRGRSQDLKVQAADIQKVNLKESQSIGMSFKPSDNMSGGEYNLMVYSEDGYLGSTGFVLQ